MRKKFEEINRRNCQAAELFITDSDPSETIYMYTNYSVPSGVLYLSSRAKKKKGMFPSY